jgi:hypothetical protein
MTTLLLALGYVLAYALIAWGVIGLPAELRMVRERYGRKVQ